MARENGTPAHAVEFFDELQRSACQYDFFQIMRRLECVFAELPRMGESHRPSEEPIRLGQKPSLKFPPAALAGLEPGHEGGPPRLMAWFFGLFGPNGPLPLHLTEYARDREVNAKDSTFAAFLDVFHHRMMTLFYRAWANAQPTVSFDRPESDRFGDYVGSIFGLGMDSLHDRDALPDVAKRHFAGRFASQTANAEGLEAILSEFFQIPARVEEFVGHWLQLPPDCQSSPGRSSEAERLGVSTVVGSQVWDRQSKFRLVLGRMSLPEFQRFLPAGESLPRLISIVRNYAGDELQWDLNLILMKEETPATQLGVQAQLGWTTWLIDNKPDDDVDEVCLDPMPYFNLKL